MGRRDSAVAARVGGALQQTISMAHDRSGVAHEIGVGLNQFRLVSRPLERGNDACVPTPLQLQRCALRAPGAPEQPTGRSDRLLQSLVPQA